jgi:ubiquinone/menaquinone biosynthesis C-methylase UbiE
MRCRERVDDVTKPRTRAIADLYDRISPAVEDAMIATLKTFGRTVPAPRTDPFYGLDRPLGADLRLMERMTAHGDFRKYVFVLDAGSGLGGVARWLSATYGCRVLLLDVFPRVLATARRLTARAGLSARLSAVGGSFDAVPVRDGIFTQIWSVQALQHATDRRRAFDELFRVLRPGSTLALHEVVRRSDAVPMIGGPWLHGTKREYLHLLAASGFVNVVATDVTPQRAERSAVTRSVEEAFLRLLSARDPDEADRWRASGDRLRAVETLTQGPDYRCVQFFAHRPSV